MAEELVQQDITRHVFASHKEPENHRYRSLRQNRLEKAKLREYEQLTEMFDSMCDDKKNKHNHKNVICH